MGKGLRLGLLLLLAPLAAAAKNDVSAYGRPHQMVDIGQGRHFNLFCQGSGAPAVIFESPYGEGGWSWFKVHPEVARKTKACVYDRAGYGFSKAKTDGDSDQAVQYLHAVLGAAGIRGPFILVGSSYGAMHAQLFAYRFPSEMAGLLLVDGQSEEEPGKLDAAMGGKFSPLLVGMAEFDAKCAKRVAQKGDTPEKSECLASNPELPAPIAEADRRSKISPAYWAAAHAEITALAGPSAEQLRAMRQKFGDFPLLILARSRSVYTRPGEAVSEKDQAIEAAHRDSLEAIRALSPQGELRVVPDAGHLIQRDQPQAVIDAVLEMVTKLRKPRSRA